MLCQQCFLHQWRCVGQQGGCSDTTISELTASVQVSLAALQLSPSPSHGNFNAATSRTSSCLFRYFTSAYCDRREIHLRSLMPQLVTAHGLCVLAGQDSCTLPVTHGITPPEPALPILPVQERTGSSVVSWQHSVLVLPSMERANSSHNGNGHV